MINYYALWVITIANAFKRNMHIQFEVYNVKFDLLNILIYILCNILSSCSMANWLYINRYAKCLYY